MKFQAISIILFAAALVRNVESTGLRGSPDHKDTNELQQQRSLFDVNGMVCGEHSAKDGSIWCTFRVMPNIATTVDSCLKVSGSDLCLSADISMGSLSVPADVSNCIIRTRYGNYCFIDISSLTFHPFYFSILFSSPLMSSSRLRYRGTIALPFRL